MKRIEWVYSHYEQAMKEWRQQVAKTDTTTGEPTQTILDGAPPPVDNSADTFDPFGAAPGQTTLPDDFVIPVDTSSFTSNLLPIGTYHGRVTGLRPGKPSTKGDPCWIWTFQVCEGEHSTKTTDNYTYTSPAAGWRFLQVKESIGFAKDEPITLGQIRNKAISWTQEANVRQDGTPGNPRVGTVMPHYKLGVGAVISEDPLSPDDPSYVPF